MSSYKYIYYFNLNLLPIDVKEYAKLLSTRKIEKYIEKAISESLEKHRTEITDYISQIIKFDRIDFDYHIESTKAMNVFVIKLKSKRISKELELVVDVINDECIDKIKDKVPSVKLIPGVTRNCLNPNK